MADGNYSAGDLNLSIMTISNDALKSLDAVIDRLSLIDKGFKSIGGVTKGASQTNGKKDNVNKGLLNLGKWTAVAYTARKLGKYVGTIVQAGSDYTETLNLWQVAMRNNLDMADEFVTKMNKAYGISTNNLMNAQATFKNMIGSLGQISDEMAYQLSESLVLMSADYASLYNRSLTSALQNMQSMLAGQVRPIRSAGLDITETTLYQYYQAIGGTKSMRQLNRTEKQLLSILAVYKQMGSAGALGDMQKTLGTYANQSRMLTEYWQELKAWTGLILKDWIDSNEILVSINAVLITTTEIIKAIAKSKGIGKEDFISGLLETTDATNESVDELQGKLLDFDKFRSLEGQEESPLAIDETLLNALSGYTSYIDEAKSAAQDLADTWLEFWINDEMGELTEKAQGLLDVLTLIGVALGTIVGIKLGTGVKKIKDVADAFALFQDSKNTGAILGNATAIEKLAKVFKFLLSPLGLILAGLSILYFTNEDFRESVNKLFGVLLEALGSVLEPIGAIFTALLPVVNTTLDAIAQILVPVVDGIAEFITLLDKAGVLQGFVLALGAIAIAFKLAVIAGNPMIFTIGAIIGGVIGLATVISSVIPNIDLIWEKIKNVMRSVGNFFANIGIGVANVFISIVNAFVDFINWIASPIDWIAEQLGKDITIPRWDVKLEYNPIPNFASGASDIDSGTVFRAGEFGKTEMVYDGANGKTNVANVKQMEQAFYNALTRHSAQGGTIVVQTYLDGELVYENTTAHAKSKGNVWANA